MWLSYSFRGPETVPLSHWTDLATLMLQPSRQLSSHPQHFLQKSRCVWASTDSLYWSKNIFNFPPLFFFFFIQTMKNGIDWHLKAKETAPCVKKCCDLQGQAWHSKQRREISPAFVSLSAQAWGIPVWSHGDSATTRWHFEHNSFTQSGLFILCLHLEYSESGAG